MTHNTDTEVVYLMAWADGLSGFDTHEAIDRVYLTLAEAEAEVERIANAVKASQASGSFGAYDRGLTILELPVGGHVAVRKGLYLARYLNDPGHNDGSKDAT